MRHPTKPAQPTALTQPHWPSCRPGAGERGAVLTWLAGIVLVGLALFGLYIWAMLSWSYSEGERAGWVQKLSKKGYICKTWEGEMAMVSLPGSVPEKFAFTIWNDADAAKVQAMMGKRVSVKYEEHIGLPTTCFGDTRYFVKDVALVRDQENPLAAPMPVQTVPGSVPPASPASPAPPAAAAPPSVPPPAPPPAAPTVPPAPK